MSVLFGLGLLLIVVFSFSVSAYVTYYKFSIQNLLGKIVVFLFLGAVVSIATFTLSLAIIWPPVM